MPSADLWGVAHQCADLVEAYTLLGELAAEGVAVVEAGPFEAGWFVGCADGSGEVVWVPVGATSGAWEVPAMGGLGGLVAQQVWQEGSADWDDSVLFGLWLPHDAVDGFGLDADHAVGPGVEVNILHREP